MKKLFEGKILMDSRIVPVHVDYHFPQELPSLFLSIEPSMHEVQDYIFYKDTDENGRLTKSMVRPIPHITYLEGWARNPEERDVLYGNVLDLLFKAQRCHYIHCTKLDLLTWKCKDNNETCRADDPEFNPVQGKCPYLYRNMEGKPEYEDILVKYNVGRLFEQTSPNMDVLTDQKPPIYRFKTTIVMTYFDERPYKVDVASAWESEDHVE